MEDIRYKLPYGRFALRAAAIIIENGKILMARSENPATPYYYTPGGAVQFGESAASAVEREVFEETGAHYIAEKLLFIHENFFTDLALYDKPHHEVCFYFLMQHRSGAVAECRGTTMGFPEHMQWLPIEQIADVRCYPEFFREYLPDLPEHCVHIVTHES